MNEVPIVIVTVNSCSELFMVPLQFTHFTDTTSCSVHWTENFFQAQTSKQAYSLMDIRFSNSTYLWAAGAVLGAFDCMMHDVFVSKFCMRDDFHRYIDSIRSTRKLCHFCKIPHISVVNIIMLVNIRIDSRCVVPALG